MPVLDKVEILLERGFSLAIGRRLGGFGEAGRVLFVLGEEVIEPVGQISDRLQVVSFDGDNGTSRLWSWACGTGIFERRANAAE